MNNLLEAVSLTKKYHNGTQELIALNGVSLSFSCADYVCIVGPSGAGKSTLLHIMGGLDVPTQGRLLWQGKDVYAMGERERALWRNKSVGFVFQFYHLIEELNVLENVTVAAFRMKRKSSLKKAQELLQYLDIESREHFFPSQLSGGEKQKVAIARALMNDPELIFCDEPTGNLDRDSQEKVVALLEELNQTMQKTIIVVTHNRELAQQAKRVFFLEAGQLKVQ